MKERNKVIVIDLYGLICIGVVGSILTSIVKSIVLGRVAEAEIKAGHKINFKI